MVESAPSEVDARPIPSDADVIRRGVLIGLGVLTVIQWRLAAWNPWNLEIFRHQALTSGSLATSVVLASVCIEGWWTFRGCFPRLLLGLAGIPLAFLALVALCSTFVWKQTVHGVEAVSPDGRVQAVRISTAGLLRSSGGLVLRITDGLDRRSDVLYECDEEQQLAGARFLDDRTLEITDRNGPKTVLVRFDKNLNPRGATPCP
ncbi:hypothetical protein [Embleya sp. NPDC005971]|uniref:hypothetical protein n=1 Tax=Embleya sp. NPDC005971 TaxID=3156724 RepID=UPI0033F4106D